MNIDLKQVNINKLLLAMINARKQNMEFDDALKFCIESQIDKINEGVDIDVPLTADDVVKAIYNEYGGVLEMIKGHFGMTNENILDRNISDIVTEDEDHLDELL